MSLNAYQRTRSITESPRASEYRLLSEITGDMLNAEHAGLRGAAMIAVLHRNRELWTAFSTACATAGNGLPDAVRASIISIALWVDRFTSLVVSGTASISELIGVNRLIMEGLSEAPKG